MIVPVSSVASDVIRPASESTADIKLDAKGKRPHFFHDTSSPTTVVSIRLKSRVLTN